jgi:hypothetical protein
VSYKSLNRIYDKSQTKPGGVITEDVEISGAGGRYGNYMGRLTYVPDFEQAISVTGKTLITHEAPISGEVYISPLNGNVQGHSTDDGDVLEVLYYPKGSCVQAEDINQLLTWSQVSQGFIPGIPQLETVNEDPGTSEFYATPPLTLIRVPSGFADFITIKTIELISTNMSVARDVPDKNTELLLTTLPAYGVTGGYGDIGVEYENGVFALLHTNDITEFGPMNQEWYYSLTTLSTPWVIDLRSGDVVINVIRPGTTNNTAQHADIIVNIKGI